MVDTHFVICVDNKGAEDLQLLKVYRILATDDPTHGMVRVVDDSGEDYLYPRSFFVPLPLPPELERQLEGVATAAR